MDNFDIRIDKEGLWYYKGAHMFRKEILNIFFDHLRIDECGKYLIELGPECCYVDVEDTAFVVVAVYKTKKSGPVPRFLFNRYVSFRKLISNNV